MKKFKTKTEKKNLKRGLWKVQVSKININKQQQKTKKGMKHKHHKQTKHAKKKKMKAQTICHIYEDVAYVLQFVIFSLIKATN